MAKLEQVWRELAHLFRTADHPNCPSKTIKHGPSFQNLPISTSAPEASSTRAPETLSGTRSPKVTRVCASCTATEVSVRKLRTRSIVGFLRQIFARLQHNLWLPALIGRLAMAGEFIPSGLGKLADLQKLTAYFVELGIPAPAVTAAISATTELVCGVLLLLGLGTRFAAAALSIVMTVAILTAKLPESHSVGDFFYQPEPAYIVIFLWLIFGGAGKVSIDHWIAHWTERKTAPRPARSNARRTPNKPVVVS